MKPIVIFVVGLFCLIIYAPVASASSSGSGYVIVDDLKDVSPINVFKLNAIDFSKKALSGEIQFIKLPNRLVSFSLSPKDMNLTKTELLGVGEGIDLATKDMIAQTKVYKGTGLDGAKNILATTTPSWVHIYFTIDEKEYVIEPVDGTGANGYYMIYSSENIDQGSPVSLANDAIVPPEVPAGNGFLLPEPQFAVANLTAVHASAAPSIQIGQIDSIVSPGDATDILSARTPESKQNRTCPAGTGDPEYRVASIAVASDKEYRSKYSDWSSRIIDTTAYLSTRYEAEVSVTFGYPTVLSVPDNLCTSTNPSDLLSQFRSYMMSTGKTYDVAHLMTGKSLLNQVLGLSYEPGVNSARYDSIGDWRYSLSCGMQDAWSRMFLMGHEIGHSFNGDHNYWGLTLDGKFTWMYAGFLPTLSADKFTADDKIRIKAWAAETLDTVRQNNPGPSTKSSNGLQASNMRITSYTTVPLVNGLMRVEFELKNTNRFDVTLAWLFIGARDASDNNRDFGHSYNVRIAAGQTFYFGDYGWPGFTSGGTWTLWPAYKLSDGSYGPYKWLTVTPTFYYKKASLDYTDYWTSADHVELFYHFWVCTTVPNPTRGSTVTVLFTLFNGNTGKSWNSYSSFFVASRINGNEAYNRDFGYSGSQMLSQQATSGATGGGCHVSATRTLDSSGTWSFWPCYSYNGSWGPWQWHLLTVIVA